MVRLLVGLLILAIVIYACYLILGMLALPPVIKTLATLVLAVIFLVVLLQKAGIAGGWDNW